ncbi:MAG: ABC transporter permease [Flavobacteriales bacterium]|nr:MAG: ABC transporter permease [Flavobacteriales bacterium]
MEKIHQHIDIKKFLPHRPPMLLVDDLLYIDKKSVTTSFKINVNCIFVSENRFMACGLIENAAQTCSAIVGQSFFKKNDHNGDSNKVIGFINHVKNVTINHLPEAGRCLISHAELISRLDTGEQTVCKMRCEIKEKEQVVSNCEITLLIKSL